MKTKKNRKQVSIEEYIESYCQEKRIRGRFAVYVSPQTHRNLKTVARLFGNKHHTTTSSLADSIISHHFETYRELLNNVQMEDRRELLEWLGSIKQCENEE
jgi:hypothetical protein